GHEILFGYLLALAAGAPAPRDGRAFVDAVAATSPRELRRLVLGGRLTTYLGDATHEVVDAAADCDPGATRALLAGCLDGQRAPYEHALSLDGDEAKRLLELACRGWHEAILGPHERDVARALRRSARSAAALSRRLRAGDLVDVTTKGVRYAGEPGIERIL